MTQIASFDLGATAAKRQQAPVQGAPRDRGDFMTAFRQAESRKQERTQDADRAVEAPVERDRDKREATEASDAPRAEQADRADKAHRSDDAQPKAVGQPNDDRTPRAEKPAEAKAEQPTSETAEAPVAEVPQVEVPEDILTLALDAQAVLALQVATGGQVVQPVVKAPEVTQAQPTQAVAVDATTETPEAAQATQQAIAQALQQAQAAPAKAQAQAQAQTQSQTQTQAMPAATATAQAQTPAFLAQAARELGPIAVQVTQQATVEAPVQAPVAEVPAEESGNLTLALLNLKTTEQAKGPTAPVTMLDGADGTEISSQPVLRVGDEEAAGALSVPEDDGAPVAPLLNGDRTTVELKAEGAKLASAPVRSEELMPQVSRHLEQLKANQANSIKLQLYPEHLGKMEIKIVSHQGVLSAQLMADSHAVKGMLESQVAQLHRTFTEMGLKVDKVEVTLASSQLGNEAQGQAAQQGDAQQFGRQNQSPSTFQANGYQQWLGDEPLDEAAYAQAESQAAVDYVA